MLRLIPTRDEGTAAAQLACLLRRPDSDRFTGCLRILHTRFRSYAATCPVPLAAAGLSVTPEIRAQCELYLPLGGIRDAFHLLYRQALAYPPVFSSSPFHAAASWADLYAGLPAAFQLSPDPARLLERLLDDAGLLQRFLFHSFLPARFYGGFERYPGQRAFIAECLRQRVERDNRPLRCLDAACGTGEDSYGLVRLLLDHGLPADSFFVEGWTVEPLEVWAAACGSFPGDPARTERFRIATGFIFEAGAARSLEFSCVDLLRPPGLSAGTGLDLVLCNGLLGGPILNGRSQVERLVVGLAGMLLPGGMLLAADSFHGGWKRKHPQEWLRVLMETAGLQVVEAGEGLAGRRTSG